VRVDSALRATARLPMQPGLQSEHFFPSSQRKNNSLDHKEIAIKYSLGILFVFLSLSFSMEVSE